MLGLLRPDTGQVLFEQAPLAPERLPAARASDGLRRAGRRALSAPDGARQRAAHGAPSGLAGGAHARRVAELAELVRLPESAFSRYPSELSGGQKQRVAPRCARSCSTPSCSFLDEPLGALDPLVRADLQDDLAAHLRAARQVRGARHARFGGGGVFRARARAPARRPHRAARLVRGSHDASGRPVRDSLRARATALRRRRGNGAERVTARTSASRARRGLSVARVSARRRGGGPRARGGFQDAPGRIQGFHRVGDPGRDGDRARARGGRSPSSIARGSAARAWFGMRSSAVRSTFIPSTAARCWTRSSAQTAAAAAPRSELRDESLARARARGPRRGHDRAARLQQHVRDRLQGRRARAALGITRISELRTRPELRFGFSNEFLSRHDGWPALEQRYGLPQTNVQGLDHDLAYRALESGEHRRHRSVHDRRRDPSLRAVAAGRTTCSSSSATTPSCCTASISRPASDRARSRACAACRARSAPSK